MKRVISAVFILVILVVGSSIATAAPNTAIGGRLGNTVQDKPELLSARYAVHNDAATGTSKLRLVLDVSQPVEVAGDLKAWPSPKLAVSIKGLEKVKTNEEMPLDGEIAEQASITVDKEGSLLVIDLPRMIDDTDYRVFTLKPDDKANRPFRVVVDINKPVPLPEYKFTAGLKGKVIAIDPGHGGSDPGAIGPNKTLEKNVTLSVSKKVKAMLEKAGAKVIMTRTADTDVASFAASAVDELSARVGIANGKKADVFLSIHTNSFTNKTAQGTSTYYYYKSAYDVMLAQNLQRNLVKEGALTDRGINPANFYVIKRTVMPAALIELAFISNPDEEKLLNSEQFQDRMAQGIVKGLDDFFVQAARVGGGR